MQISRRSVLAYTLMPQVIPRIQALFGSGFSHIAYFIALLYSAVRLLPSGHPYTLPQNIGRFGIRHVIGEAANNLTIDLKHIDQVLVFACVLIGIVIGLIQMIIFVGALFVGPVVAAGFGTFFSTPNPAQDLAHMMMDMVFGVPGVFNSCISMQGAPCVDLDGKTIESFAKLTGELGWPYPIHFALHQLLAFYSMGLLTVAVMITTYFVFTIALETAQSGTPFGKRYNKVWAPLRIIMAFGLLIPIGHGLNSAQYIVLYAAKYGSAFASNGWAVFNNQISNEFLGQTKNLVSQPSTPEVTSMLQFMFTAKVCSILENQDAENEANHVKPYLVKNPLHPVNNRLLTGNSPSYEEYIRFVNGATKARIVFGVHDEEKYARYAGNVNPVCGEVAINLSDPRWAAAAESPEAAEPGIEVMQKYYWFIVNELWFKENETADFGFRKEPQRHVDYHVNNSEERNLIQREEGFQTRVQQAYSTDLEAAMLDPSLTGLDEWADINEGAIPAQAASGTWESNPAFLDKGWAVAGIWYNKIAELNGSLTGAVFNIPTVAKYPMVMEEVYRTKKLYDQAIDVQKRFEPGLLANGKAMKLTSVDGDAMQKAGVLWEAFDMWSNASASTHTTSTGNAFNETINAILGTEGLYSMRRNRDVHPLAQLVGIGKSLIESTINNIGYSVVGAGFGGLTNLFSGALGEASNMMIGFVVSISMVALVIGFVLFYIVPFLPFIYFFFAVGGWIKGIFEALVGAPLWALAHIRIDGQGLPGQAGKSGYFLILEIFIRPILTVFGLLAGISIFSATVLVLNDIWDLVTSNLTGFDVNAESSLSNSLSGESIESATDYFRGPIDEFFYTAVYAVVVYMMGMSSFKLIDMIPNQILRWMGSDVSSFNDTREEVASKMMSTAYLGTDQVLSGLDQPLKQGVEMATKKT